MYQNLWLGRIQDLEQENKELKKQLEKNDDLVDKAIRVSLNQKSTIENYKYKIDVLKIQQKEFIELLENEITLRERKTYEIAIIKDDTAVFVWKIKLELLKEVLSKYKELIGVKDE